MGMSQPQRYPVPCGTGGAQVQMELPDPPFQCSRALATEQDCYRVPEAGFCHLGFTQVAKEPSAWPAVVLPGVLQSPEDHTGTPDSPTELETDGSCYHYHNQPTPIRASATIDGSCHIRLSPGQPRFPGFTLSQSDPMPLHDI